MKTRKWILVLLVLVISAVGVSAVGAQDVLDAQRGEGRRGARGELLRSLVEIVTQETGLTASEIVQTVRDGSTLAEAITASGGDVQSVTNQAVTVLTDAINQAVADGKITQERADQMITNLPETISNALNGELRQEAGERMVLRGVMRLAAEETGLSAQEIAEQMRTGKSLATVLTENGVDVTAFITTAVTQADERLDQAVENGRITQERADEMLAEFQARLTEKIYEVPAASA
jgi:polyhydroxyalkanoate synthesis regulator phasin